ncbi:SRA stem-loop-interacting RNA-binding protein, mitochondrial-like [Nilaparvata lugens]|uniref:SRA stem-loop-interacting RNA-binding protein, mitochondrial-like n=1 Tax=Nilaparvata lugens TaxID=108931 RepID=UPI000B980504|nr:SRA stem-loop-interacting RNA-binding protein, mitochondrial-like [Nilaparvata lugens]
MASAARNLHKIFVGNVPWTVAHNELKQYFSEFGHVSNVSVVFDRNTGMSRGYGFVTFSHQNGLDAATSRQKHFLEGNTLFLQPASNN